MLKRITITGYWIKGELAIKSEEDSQKYKNSGYTEKPLFLRNQKGRIVDDTLPLPCLAWIPDLDFEGIAVTYCMV